MRRGVDPSRLRDALAGERLPAAVLVDRDSAAFREETLRAKQPPRDAWRLECVQDDMANPLPCTAEEKKLYPNGQLPEPPDEDPKKGDAAKGDAKDPDADDDDEDSDSIREAFKKRMAGDKTDPKDDGKKDDGKDDKKGDDGKKDDEDEEKEESEEEIRAKMRKLQKP